MKKANAEPTKDFFVSMITKDISLQDCILDLIDNCLDGASRTSQAVNGKPKYDGFKARLRIDPHEFAIEDNCGGISISNAIDYAFRFGRHPDAPDDGEFSIGLYGIGMKRAIFKIGKTIDIRSSTAGEGFVCNISVDEWLEHNTWEFDMEDASVEDAGTVIRIRDLNKGISEEFGDPTFVSGLTRIIARDYSRFIEYGFEVAINGNAVKGHRYEVRTSEEFKPYRHTYEDESVEVDIVAGMAASPPDSNEPAVRPEYESYGWFVFCNDRVVLAADKTDRTIWGHEGFTHWHPQYNGFIGIALFRGSDPNLLPWTTTKRDVDESSPLYRRAVVEMKKAAQPWIEYTNKRKADLNEARQREEKASPKSIFTLPRNTTFLVPHLPATPAVPIANISYQKPRQQVKKAAKALGNSFMSYKNVGEKTFEYYIENEVDGDD